MVFSSTPGWAARDPVLRQYVGPASERSQLPRYSRCANCHNLDIKGYPFAKTVSVNNNPKRSAVLEQFYFADLEYKSCGYCDLISRAIKAFYPQFDLSSNDFGDVKLETITLTENEPILLTINVKAKGKDGFVDQGIEIFREPDQRVDALPGLGCAMSKVDGELKFTDDCLRNCSQNHRSCMVPRAHIGEFKYPILPTRVLNLACFQQNSDDLYAPVRLDHPHYSTRAPYAALSHCWGTEPIPLQLFEANIHELGFCILFSNLPETHADAVLVARKLGMPYLWIDSLCIIQDCPGDKSVEIAGMARVYNYAHVTIAATRSSSHATPFLQQPDSEYTSKAIHFYGPKKHVVRLSQSFAGLTVGLPKGPLSRLRATTLYARRTQRFVKESEWRLSRPASTRTASDYVEGPLSRRAWTLQERALSRRIVHFTCEGVRWECRHEMRLSDGRNWQDSWGHVGQWARIEDTMKDTNIMNFALAMMDGEEELWAFWRKMLPEYTARAITNRSDRLPALAGLASAAISLLPGPVRQEDYLAGLWKRTIVEDLSWDPAAFQGHHGSLNDPRTLHEDIHLPSWSWISINRPISYSWGESVGTWRSTTKFIKAAVTPEDTTGLGSLGEIFSCGILLGGPVLPAKLNYSNSPPENYNYNPHCVDFGIAGLRPVDLVPDTPLILDEYTENGMRVKTFRRALAGGEYEIKHLSEAAIDKMKQEVDENKLEGNKTRIEHIRRSDGTLCRKVWRRVDGDTQTKGEADVLCLKLGQWIPGDVNESPQHFVMVLAPSPLFANKYRRLGLLEKNFPGNTRPDMDDGKIDIWKTAPMRNIMIV